jgi:dTDP-4-dehydrorhamnose reductase
VSGGHDAEDDARGSSSPLAAFTRAEPAIHGMDALQRAIPDAKPDWVINASGYTSVAASESDPESIHAG